MQVCSFSLGPIIGETTPRRVRLLCRAEPSAFPGRQKVMAGRLQWRRRGDSEWQGPVRFRFNRNFDFTGVVVLDGLQPGTAYELRAGWVQEPDADDDRLQWGNASSATFRTAPDDDHAPVEFFFGSCCYRFFSRAGRLEDDRGDKAFRSMLANQQQDGDVDFSLFVGDQVYADPLHTLGDISEQEDYFALYRSAFTQPHLRSLLASGSTYMILDDHEIENDWPASAEPADRVGKYPAALKAYQIYQAVHGPVTPLTADGRYPAMDPDRLWYSFRRGCADFFVMDVRTERVLAGRASQMISRRQEEALCDWLAHQPERVKCIVSPVAVFPDAHRLFRTGDAWDGFRRQRTRLLEHIRRLALPRVVFLSGDVHASLYARLDCRAPGGRPVSMHSLISSGLFWPVSLFPFRWFDWMLPASVRLCTPGTWRRYRVTRPGPVYSGNGFARVRLSPQGLDFRIFDRKGEPVPENRNQVTFLPE
jgi:alkaline phosphatase D